MPFENFNKFRLLEFKFLSIQTQVIFDQKKKGETERKRL